jgi:hypothetical protein
MARIRPRGTAIRDHGQILRPVRTIKTKVQLYRTASPGHHAFRACVVVGSAGYATKSRRYDPDRNSSCEFGKNPRVALSRAMQNVARAFAQRKGAFAGLSGLGKRRRKGR